MAARIVGVTEHLPRQRCVDPRQICSRLAEFGEALGAQFRQEIQGAEVPPRTRELGGVKSGKRLQPFERRLADGLS